MLQNYIIFFICKGFIQKIAVNFQKQILTEKSIVTKNIQASKYKSIEVEFNWVHSTKDSSEVIHNVILPLSRAISQKSITGHEEVCISTYVQARFIWTDINNAIAIGVHIRELAKKHKVAATNKKAHNNFRA